MIEKIREAFRNETNNTKDNPVIQAIIIASWVEALTIFLILLLPFNTITMIRAFYMATQTTGFLSTIWILDGLLQIGACIITMFFWYLANPAPYFKNIIKTTIKIFKLKIKAYKQDKHPVFCDCGRLSNTLSKTENVSWKCKVCKTEDDEK